MRCRLVAVGKLIPSITTSKPGFPERLAFCFLFYILFNSAFFFEIWIIICRKYIEFCKSCYSPIKFSPSIQRSESRQAQPPHRGLFSNPDLQNPDLRLRTISPLSTCHDPPSLSLNRDEKPLNDSQPPRPQRTLRISAAPPYKPANPSQSNHSTHPPQTPHVQNPPSSSSSPYSAHQHTSTSNTTLPPQSLIYAFHLGVATTLTKKSALPDRSRQRQHPANIMRPLSHMTYSSIIFLFVNVRSWARGVAVWRQSAGCVAAYR